jgi:hypothetical protein
MPNMPTRPRGIRPKGLAFWPMAILICAAAAGCNRFREPQTIDPETELTMSEKTVPIGSRTLKVPHTWTADMLARWDEKGRPLTVYVVRPNAHMRFEVTKEPLWGRGNDDVRETSTKVHKHVTYKLLSTQEPSGDDTPAGFEISAYFKENDTFWCMAVRFATPVRPDLLEAVKYIDAIGQKEPDPPSESESLK